MIADTLNSYRTYFTPGNSAGSRGGGDRGTGGGTGIGGGPAGPGIAEGLRYLAETHCAELSDGRHELAGGSFLLLLSYSTQPEAERRFESHRLHVDIQLILSGEEWIYWTLSTELRADEPYNEEKDVQLYADRPADVSASRLVATPGMFFLFFPHDAHMPNCAPEARSAESGRVRKAVVKVPIPGATRHYR